VAPPGITPPGVILSTCSGSNSDSLFSNSYGLTFNLPANCATLSEPSTCSN
jgi:hypothetical protein